MIKTFFLLCKHVDKYFYLKILCLNFLYIINSFIQIIYVLSIAPIISFITSANSEIFSKFIDKILTFGNLFFDSKIIIFFIFFVFCSLVANIFVIILNFLNFSFNQSLLSNFRKKLFLTYANSDYLFISSNNLSFYNMIIFQQVDRLVNNVLGSVNLILQNLFVILVTSFTIFSIIKSDSFIIFGALFFVFVLAVFISKTYFAKKGNDLNTILKGRVDILNKLILNFKEINIYGIKNYLFSKFEFFEDAFNRNIKYSSFINHSSKPFIEIIAVMGFAILIYFNLSSFQRGDFVIQISIIVFALYKLLPSANVIYTAFNQIMYDSSSINIIHKQILNNNEIIHYENKTNLFQNSIKTLKIENLQFSFNSKELIKNFSYEFNEGNFYLIKGVSGKGKTTFLNLVMGVIKSEKGNFYYNKKKFNNFNNLSWFKVLSYVPQRITLLNDTLKDNITFSFDKNYDVEKYKNILKQLNIHNEFSGRENEMINEYSSNLSGGQSQRIGLARALYRNSKIILLDEPTSSLDENNERKFLNIVQSLKKDRIIIMISHKNHGNIQFDDIIDF